MDAVTNSLGRKEQDLLRATEPKRLKPLDEDELMELHRRVRRARNKYVGVYRRKGSAKVKKRGGRGLAKSTNARNAARAEVFEDALSRVSGQLAAAAAATAAQLRADRLAAAAPAGTWPGADTPSVARDAKKSPKVTDRTPKGAGGTNRVATSTAAGARRQAKKDAR